MWISNKRHQELVKTLTQQREFLIANYEARITQYEAQIEDLRRLVFTPNTSEDVPLVAREADAIISVTETPTLSPEAAKIAAQEIEEFEQIMSGQWEKGLDS